MCTLDIDRYSDLYSFSLCSVQLVFCSASAGVLYIFDLSPVHFEFVFFTRLVVFCTNLASVLYSFDFILCLFFITLEKVQIEL